MTATGADLLRQEYREVNAHLRANTTQFVNWFSFFLTFSFVAAAIFLVAGAHLTRHQWREGDVALLAGAAARLGLPADEVAAGVRRGDDDPWRTP